MENKKTFFSAAARSRSARGTSQQSPTKTKSFNVKMLSKSKFSKRFSRRLLFRDLSSQRLGPFGQILTDPPANLIDILGYLLRQLPIFRDCHAGDDLTWLLPNGGSRSGLCELPSISTVDSFVDIF